MKIFHLPGKELYGSKFVFVKKKNPDKSYFQEVETMLNTSSDVFLDTSLVKDSNLDLLLQTINFDNIDELRKGTGYQKFKYLNMMSPKFKERFAGKNIDFESQGEIYDNLSLKLSGQRSVIIKLDEPINGFSAIKVKGLVYTNIIEKNKILDLTLNPVIYSPYSGIGAPTTRGTLVHFCGDGRVKREQGDDNLKRPHGGMIERRAKKEYEITKENMELGLPVCLPLGYGLFSSEDYDPKKQDNPYDSWKIIDRAAFVILGIKDHKDSRLPWTIYENKDRKDFNDFVDDMFFQYGKGLRNFHDKLSFMGLPYIENVSYNGQIIFHDLDGAKIFNYLTPKQEIMYRLSDIEAATQIISVTNKSPDRSEEFAGMMEEEEGMSGYVLRNYAFANIERLFHEKKTKPVIKSFSRGYFGKEFKFCGNELHCNISNIFNQNKLTRMKVYKKVKKILKS